MTKTSIAAACLKTLPATQIKMSERESTDRKALEKANASLTKFFDYCDDDLYRGDILQIILPIREALEK